MRVCALNSWFSSKTDADNKVRREASGDFHQRRKRGVILVHLSNELIITNDEYVYVHTNKLLFLLN